MKTAEKINVCLNNWHPDVIFSSIDRMAAGKVPGPEGWLQITGKT
jgi:hypothetical protein